MCMLVDMYAIRVHMCISIIIRTTHAYNAHAIYNVCMWFRELTDHMTDGLQIIPTRKNVRVLV